MAKEQKNIVGATPHQFCVDAMMARLNWPYWTPHQIIAQGVSELGELANVVNHDFGPKRPKPGDELDEELELGDLYFAVLCYANSRGISLQTALERAMEKFSTRDKERFTEGKDV